MKFVKLHRFGLLSLLILPLTLFAQTLKVPVYHVAAGDTQGAAMGTVTFEDTDMGMLITPDLYGFTPGLHGFHLHVNNSCANGGMSAGGHFDPDNSGKHLGPYDVRGHLGDMPALYADSEGDITLPVLAPRLKVSMLPGHAIMVHQGGDNYYDIPAALGGGGPRIGCGVIAVTTTNTPTKA